MGNKSSLMLQDEEIKQISDETGFSPTQIEKLYSRFAHLDRSSCGSLSKNDLMSIPELAINPLCDRLIQMFFNSCDSDSDERINFRQFMQVLAAFRSSSTNHSNYQSGSSVHRNHRSNGATNAIKNISTSSHNSNTNDHHHQQHHHLRQGAHSARSIDLTLDHNHNGQATNKTIRNIDRPKGHRQDLHIPQGRISDGKQDGTTDTINEGLRNKLLFVFKIYDADNDGRVSFGDLRSILKMMVGNYIEDVQLDKIATRAFVEVDQDNDGFIEFSEFCRVFASKDLDDKLRVKFFN